MHTRHPTLHQLAADLKSGKTTSRALVEDGLARIADKDGEGRRAFSKVADSQARAAADAMDRLRAAGIAPSPYAGIPISIKDLFDMAGEVTTAGSRVLADAPPAAVDAPCVARLRGAGFVVMGRTTMTEFAYSGLGLNPHYGTPVNAWDRAAKRIPGGSSSGAAISVASGMAHAALGTDTGGSTRIPAAFNGLVGYKPTANRVPRNGVVPLSTSLDSVGPIARSVDCCAILDHILAGSADSSSSSIPDARPVSGLRLAIPQSVALDGLDADVSRAFRQAVTALSGAGAKIADVPFKELHRVGSINARGGLSAAESYAWHHALLESKADLYDPRVRTRIVRGEGYTARDYIDLLAQRRELIREVEDSLAPFDALICPTVAIVPPRFSDLESDERYLAINGLVLRNTGFVNMFDGCAISIPVHAPDEAPVGLMLAAVGGQDARLFQTAAAVERLFARR